jgi:hypothetical protein
MAGSGGVTHQSTRLLELTERHFIEKRQGFKPEGKLLQVEGTMRAESLNAKRPNHPTGHTDLYVAPFDLVSIHNLAAMGSRVAIASRLSEVFKEREICPDHFGRLVPGNQSVIGGLYTSKLNRRMFR